MHTRIIIASFLLLPFCGIGATTDSLLTLLNQAITAEDLSAQSNLELALGKSYFDTNNLEESIGHLLKAKSLTESKGDKVYKESLLWLGKAYRSSNKNDEAISTLNSLLISVEKGDERIKADASQELSKAYARIGKQDKSFDYALKAMTIWEKLEDTTGIIKCLYQIGGDFFYQGNYKLALDYYFKTKKLAEKTDNKRYIFNSNAALGGTYSRMWETEKSIEYNLKSLEMAEEMGYEVGIAYAAQNIGSNYYAWEKYDSAVYYFQKSLEMKEGLNDKWGSIASLQFIGNSYAKQKNLEAGLEYLNKAMELSYEINSTARILECYSMLAEAYGENDEPETSNFLLRRYIHLKDSLINESTQQKLAEAQTRYEVLKKEAELNKKKEEIGNIYRGVVIVGFVVLVIIIWLIYKRLQEQFTSNQLLEEKNQQISDQLEALAAANKKQIETNILLQETNQKIKDQNQVLEQTNHRLKVSNASLEDFAHITSHDLKEPLRNIGSYASLLKRRYEDRLDKEGVEFLSFITGGVSKMYNLLNEVLKFAKINQETELNQNVDINDVIETVKRNLNNQIEQKEAIIQTQNLPELKVNQFHMVQLFQNLVGNGVQYSNGEKPIISINCRKEDEHYLFSVMDNGVGIDMEYKDKIFEMFQRLDRSDGSDGTGIGLAICKKVVENYGGDIWVESEEGKGSTFYFTFPHVN